MEAWSLCTGDDKPLGSITGDPLVKWITVSLRPCSTSLFVSSLTVLGGNHNTYSYTPQMKKKCFKARWTNIQPKKKEICYTYKSKSTSPWSKNKLHKINMPVRPVINNTRTPSYKTAKSIMKTLKHLLDLQYEYNKTNSTELAQKLHTFKMLLTHIIMTLGINKHKYTNWWSNKNSQNIIN